MAQKKHTQSVITKQVGSNTNAQTEIAAPKISLLNFRTQAIILVLIGFVFYCNTFSHEYAFDDMMAIVDNDYVQQGITGIPKILTTDAYQSYLEHKNGGNQLAGGRYRPLSLITFAIEQHILGIYTPTESVTENSQTQQANAAQKEAKLVADMHFRHIVNVLLYLLTIVVLLYFLRCVILPDNPLIAFIAALLFTIHPIHTEVVANVKSRDELLSVLFIALTFIQLYRYDTGKKLKNLFWSLVCFFLALLSKEYAVTLIILLPLSFYIFKKDTILKSLIKCLPFLVPLLLYFLMRFSAVSGPAEGAENNVMNNPYLYATGLQQLATEILVLLNYIKLLFIPNPLIADYSYSQIPYTSFANPLVIVSLILHFILLAIMATTILKRNIIGFALAIYFANLALVCNILFNIGAPMGERLIFHSSIGFCILIAYLLVIGVEKIKSIRLSISLLAAIMLQIIALSGYKTIARNRDWKNNETLFLHDVNFATNSVLVNNDAAASCMNLAKQTADTATRKQWFAKAIGYFTKAIALHPKYSLAYLNRGLCYFNSGLPDKALTDWDTVRIQSPAQQNLNKYLSIAGKYYMGHAIKYLQTGNTDQAIEAFNKAIEATPTAPEVWYNLGVTNLNLGKNNEAKTALERALQLAPNNAEVMKMLGRVK